MMKGERQDRLIGGSYECGRPFAIFDTKLCDELQPWNGFKEKNEQINYLTYRYGHSNTVLPQVQWVHWKILPGCIELRVMRQRKTSLKIYQTRPEMYLGRE